MACTYRSVILQPGESYVLPAGAQIVSATDSGSITSVNDCANLDNLEELECYFIQVSNANDGNRSGNLNEMTLKGFFLGSTYYPFTAGSIEVGTEFSNMFFPTPNINNSRFISEYELVFGTLSFKTFQAQSDSDYGTAIWYVFKVPKSIGDNLSIIADSLTANVGSGTGYQPIEVWFNARPISEWTGRAAAPADCV